MKAGEILAQVDAVSPNTYGQDLKLQWLTDLDVKLWHEMVKEGEEPSTYVINDELLFGAEARPMYVSYILAMIAYTNHEFSLYNNHMIMFNAEHSDFSASFNRKNAQQRTRWRNL